MLKKIVRRHAIPHGLSGSNTSRTEHRSTGGALAPHFSLLGSVVLLAPLTILGEWLIAHTHHRPLGAATFASATIVLWVAFEVGSRLLFARRRERPDQVRRMKNAILSVALVCCVAVFARVLL